MGMEIKGRLGKKMEIKLELRGLVKSYSRIFSGLSMSQFIFG